MLVRVILLRILQMGIIQTHARRTGYNIDNAVHVPKLRSIEEKKDEEEHLQFLKFCGQNHELSRPGRLITP